jgi:two-component system, chemotaxis family, chemotaxis protein CheY
MQGGGAMSLNVLIVDDSAVMRTMIIKVLRLCGLSLGEVFQAANGEEGLRLLNANWIDLAMVDIHMPVMDGEEMIARLRQSPATIDLPVIIVTSESDQKRIGMLMQSGASYIRKPFTVETLRDMIITTTGCGNEGGDR